MRRMSSRDIMKVRLLLLVLGLITGLAAQSVAGSDSLSLDQAIQLTLASHPSIVQARSGVTASAARIDQAHSPNYPNLFLSGDYTRIGPVPEFDLGGEVLELAPRNNYDLHVGLRQTLYDFGKTETAIALAESGHQSASDYVDLVKTRLAYETIATFNAILILRENLMVLDDQIATLQQHLDESNKRIEAGTATDFDTLTTQVRISIVRNQKIDDRRSLEAQEIMLRQLTGLPSGSELNLKGSFSQSDTTFVLDSLIGAAKRQRVELILSRDAESTAVVQGHLVSFGDKPQVAFHFAAGFANGYEPNLNTIKGNYAAGVQVHVPVFDGHLTRHQQEEAEANLHSAQAHTGDALRQVISEVEQAEAGVRSSQEKIRSSELQVAEAEKALAMARTRYAAGVITNLDLLDAETTLSQAKLIRLRASYDYTVSRYSLDRATGKKVW